MRHFTEYKQFAFQVRISYGAYLTDLAKKCYLGAYLAISAQNELSLHPWSYLWEQIAISARIQLSMYRDSYLCAHLAVSAQR